MILIIDTSEFRTSDSLRGHEEGERLNRLEILLRVIRITPRRFSSISSIFALREWESESAHSNKVANTFLAGCPS